MYFTFQYPLVNSTENCDQLLLSPYMQLSTVSLLLIIQVYLVQALVSHYFPRQGRGEKFECCDTARSCSCTAGSPYNGMISIDRLLFYTHHVAMSNWEPLVAVQVEFRTD